MKKGTQKSDLSKKIKMYSTIATALIAANQSAKAGIVYTNVDPDISIDTTGGYEIDLNNDFIPDFYLKVRSESWTNYGFFMKSNAAMIYANENNFINALSYPLINYSGSAKIPVLHNSDDVINNSLNWISTSSSTSGMFLGLNITKNGAPFETVGNWAGISDKYMGVKFTGGSNTYYGWIRLDVNTDLSSITLKDYAYNDTPSQSILAGEGQTASIKETTLKQVSAYGFQNKININFLNGQLPKGSIEVSNVLGQKVFTSTINEAHSTITIDDPSGNFYIVSIQTEKGVFTKKVFLQNK